MTLKTLKDLDLGINDSDVNCICGRLLKEHDWKDSGCKDFTPIKKVLKREAIKWYKNADTDCKAFIVTFFNLTEEELK